MSDDLVEARVRAVLDALGAQHQWLDCEPAFADTAAFCERYGVAAEDSANTILVSSRRGPERRVACVLLASTRLDVNGTVRRLMAVPKASFATAEETVAATGMVIGGVTPFGLPADLPVLVDSAVMTRDSVVTGAGSRRAKLRLAPAVLRRLDAVSVVEGLAAPRAG